MGDKVTKQIRKSIRQYCKPLISICLTNGITANDFIAIIKSAFVETASRDFGIKGRQANLSRVSIMTGLSRKEVKRLRHDNANQQGENFQTASPIGRVLAAWHNDPDYLSRTGAPKPLPYEGKGKSFKTLAKKYVGDIPISAILRELEKNNLIKEDHKGCIKPVSQSFIRDGIDSDAVERLGDVVNELATTISKNFELKDGKRFERRLLTGRISKEEALVFHELVKEQGASFLKFLESWLFERGISDIDSDGNGDHRAGVGIFFFEEQYPS